MLGIQRLIWGIASSSDERTAPAAPRITAMTNGRIRKPPRSLYIVERNKTRRRSNIADAHLSSKDTAALTSDSGETARPEAPKAPETGRDIGDATLSREAPKQVFAAALTRRHLGEPIRPKQVAPFRTGRKFRAPPHLVHAANQLQLPRIDPPSDRGQYEPILDIGVNDL